MNALSKLTLSEACLRELLRKYSVVPTVSRRMIQSTDMPNEFNSYYTLPKNTSVFISIQAVHHNPNYWVNPKVFNPYRFLKEDDNNDDNDDNNDKAHIVPYTFLAFIDGPRNCLGQYLSLLESKIVLSRLIQKYDFRFVNETLDNLKNKDYDPRHRIMVPVVPRDGVVSVFVKRKENVT